jgi:putative DNA primase/helicase
MSLNPKFSIPIPNQHLISAIKQTDSKSKISKHTEVLKKLLNQFKPIDFSSRSFEEYDKLMKMYEDEKTLDKDDLFKKLSKFRLQERHYYICCIDEVQNIARENNWDIVRHNDEIYLYNGEYWQKVESDVFQIFLADVARVLGVPSMIEKHHGFREQLQKQFDVTQIFATPELHRSDIYINLLDCTLQASNGEVKNIPFNKEHFLNYQLPYKYDSAAKCPLFMAFLSEVLPDESAQQVLSEYLGYLFIRNGNKSIKAEKMLVLYGSGANGKSVVFEIILALLGRENVSNYSLTSLTDTNGYYRAQISNKLVNYGSEIGGKLEADMLKKMASGEPIEARQPYGRPLLLHEYAKLIFNCNQLPKDVEQTDAYFRRFLILPFNVTIEEEKQDKHLANKIVESELPGILNWVLEGLKSLLSQGRFSKCKISDDMLIRYKIESDSVQIYLEEYSIQKSSDTKEFITLKTVYDAYRVFCLESGYKPISKLNFSKRLQSLKFLIEKRNIGKVVLLSTPLENVFSEGHFCHS